jgi:hypothetical protein
MRQRVEVVSQTQIPMDITTDATVSVSVPRHIKATRGERRMVKVTPAKRLRLRGQGRIRVEVHRAILRLRRVKPGFEDVYNLLAAIQKLENVEASLVAGRWTKVPRKEK